MPKKHNVALVAFAAEGAKVKAEDALSIDK